MDQLEYFDQYLNNLLSSLERSDFERKLDKDQKFNQAYQEFLSMDEFLTIKPEVDEGKKKIKELRSTYESKENDSPETSTRRILYILAAASLAAIILIYFLSRPKETTQTLYAANFQPKSISIATKSGSTIEQNISKGLASFNSGDYLEAYTLLDTIGVEPSNVPEILFAKGIAGITTSNSTEAEGILTFLAENYPTFENDANWYLALSNLKVENLEAVIRYLEKIPESSNRFVQREKLLADIKKLN